MEVTGSWPVSTDQTIALRAVSKDSFLTCVASHCHHLACHKPYQESYKNSLTDFSPILKACSLLTEFKSSLPQPHISSPPTSATSFQTRIYRN